MYKRQVAFTSTIPISPFPVEPQEKKSQSTTNVGQKTESCVPSSPQTLQEISDELKKIFLYWQAQADRKNEKMKPIKRILLAGEEAGRPGFVEFISKTFNIPTEVAGVWQNAFSLENYIPSISKNESLGYVAAIGLALVQRPE